MKANEAPEKIYIDANEDWHRTYTAFTEKAKGNDIKYIRADAFIEKACEFIYFNIADYIDVTHHGGIERVVLQERVIEDFRNYMKGE